MSRLELRARHAAVASMALLGFLAGRSAFSFKGDLDPFTRSAFGPAVMVAIGHGFVNPEPPPGSDLEKFLDGRLSRIAPSAANVRVGTATPEQRQHRYLLTTVGTWWRATDISWQRLAEIAALMHAMAVAAAYALFRLCLAQWPALAGAAWFAVAPVVVRYASHLRDFSKSPFIIAALALLVFVVWRATNRRHVVLGAAGIGALIGAGLGFRVDVVVMAPVSVLGLLLFRGATPWNELTTKAIAAGCLVLAAGVTSAPLRAAASGTGTNTFHVILLGQSEWFDAPLGVDTPPYSVLRYYSDSYLEQTLRARAEPAMQSPLAVPSPEYDRVARSLWLDVVRRLPADAYMRLLGAVDGVFNLPLPSRRWGALLGVALVIGAARQGIKTAIFAAMLILALAGYSSLQFDPRHSFHLAIFPIFTIVMLVWWIAGNILQRVAPHADVRPRMPFAVGLVRAALTGLALVMCTTVLPVAALRAYQEPRLESSIDEWMASAGAPLDLELTAAGDDRWLVSWPDVEGQRLPSGYAAAYYLMEFDADRHDSVFAARLRFDAEPDWKQCPTSLAVFSPPGIARLAFPVYSVQDRGRFRGIEIGDYARRRLKAIHRMDSGPGRLPLELRLPADWGTGEPLFQRSLLESRQADSGVVFTSSSARECGDAFDLLTASSAPELLPQRSWASVTAPGVTFDERGIAVEDARASEPGQRLLLQPVQVEAGESLVALVTLDRGGIAVGWSDERSTREDVVLQTPGHVVIAVTASRTGRYFAYADDARPWLAGATRARIHRLGIARAHGGARGMGVTAP